MAAVGAKGSLVATSVSVVPRESTHLVFARLDRASNSNGPDVLRLARFFPADEQSLVPRSLALVDWTYRYGGPPRRSIARVCFIPTEQSGSPRKVLAIDCLWREAVVHTRALPNGGLRILHRQAHRRDTGFNAPISADGCSFSTPSCHLVWLRACLAAHTIVATARETARLAARCLVLCGQPNTISEQSNRLDQYV